MPYIKPADREKFEGFNHALTSETDIETPGELNYLITRLILAYKDNRPPGYQTINDIIGALEGAKLEFYRRSAAPYEDEKIEENGDVYLSYE